MSSKNLAKDGMVVRVFDVENQRYGYALLSQLNGKICVKYDDNTTAWIDAGQVRMANRPDEKSTYVGL